MSSSDLALPSAGVPPAAPPPTPPAPARAAPDTTPLKGAALILGTLTLSLATFMNVLDTSIANVSIPAIAGDLGVSPAQGTWVITSFAVANAISVPLTGWLARRVGAVRLFVISVLLFSLASLLCGLAPSIELLIFFRVVQGLVAGPMIPLSQTLLMSSYPREKVGTALSIWSMTTLVAPVMGPLLGGWITDNMSWPWIFYINVPVGLFAGMVTWSIFRKRDAGPTKLPLDYVGLALLILWVGSLQIMLDKGKELDWFNSGLIQILALVAVVGFIFFLVWELTDEHPIIDLKLFASRNFVFGVMTVAVGYGIFFGNLVLLPLWLQQIVGYPATLAGMALAPVGVMAIFLSPWVGKNVGKIDARILGTVSFLVFSLVLYMRAQFTFDSDFMTYMIPTVIQGVAVAFFFIPLMAIVMGGLEPSRVPSAAGLSNFCRITAGAVGTSLFSTAWEDRATMHHANLAANIDSGNSAATTAMSNLAAAGLDPQQSIGLVNRLIDQQAYTMSVTDLFYISSILFLLLIPMVWMTKRYRTAAPSDGGGAH